MTTRQPHKIGSGFDARSTVTDVLHSVDLSGCTALVTGGYSGLGLEITKAITSAGARVVVPARRPAVAADALRGLDRVEIHALDLADLGSIKAFADDVVASGRHLDIVINNAGIMACPETRVGPGWEAHFAVNHLGHFALVNHLAPVLGDAPARVVSVSSSGHFLSGIRWDDIHFTSGYDEWLAYGQSKTANALFAAHLDALGADTGLHAFSVHPGSIITPLQRRVPREKQVALGWLTPDGRPNPAFKTAAQGAATAVWAATSPALEGYGGAYLQDCDIAEPATTDDMGIGGVKPWVLDPGEAARLWEYSADVTSVDGFG